MSIPKLGEPARPFTLPAAQGGEVSLEDYKGRHSLVLWFTKGMACVFCRQQMSQLSRAYQRIKEHGGDIVQVTTSPLSRARFYAGKFALPFTYLCDPESQVFRAWGLVNRSHGPVYYAQTLVRGLRAPQVENDFGAFKPAVTEMPALLSDDDMGFFIVDKQGIVRYATTGAYRADGSGVSLPGNEEVLRELGKLSA